MVLTLPELILQDMTTEEKVGQLFLARCPSYDAAEDAATYHLGGYVLFGRDFEDRSKEDVISDIASYQAAAKIPMLIAVDEEGGIVCRVSPYFRDTRFPAPRKLYDQGGLKLILATETEKIQLLQSFGINVNLAPVRCDHRSGCLYVQPLPGTIAGGNRPGHRIHGEFDEPFQFWLRAEALPRLRQ